MFLLSVLFKKLYFYIFVYYLGNFSEKQLYVGLPFCASFIYYTEVVSLNILSVPDKLYTHIKKSQKLCSKTNN